MLNRLDHSVSAGNEKSTLREAHHMWLQGYFSFLADKIVAKPIKDDQVIVDDHINSKACRRQGYIFIQYLYGIRSMRQTIKEIEVNAAYRWFLGISFLDKVPSSQHSVRIIPDVLKTRICLNRYSLISWMNVSDLIL